MESLFSLLLVMGVNSTLELDVNYFDIVGKLPVEIAVMILRRLDSRTLLSASRVNRRWFALCRSDSVLRARIKAEIRRQRLEHVNPVRVEIHRPTQNVCRPFMSMNGLQQKQVTFTTGTTNIEHSLVRERVVQSHKVSGKEKKLRKPAHKTAATKPKKAMRF